MTLNSDFFRPFVLLAMLILLPGCIAGGAITQKVFGPMPVDARYKLAKVPTLILVENYRNPSSLRYESENLARAIAEEFTKQDLAPLVDSDRVFLVRDNDPRAYRAMTIPAIGRACGAKQVVYVDIRQLDFGVEDIQHTAKGRGEVRVRVIDCKDGIPLWPQDAAEGMPVSYTTKLVSDAATEDAIRAKVVYGAADRVARLFYSYKPDEVPE